jgi:transcriptional regulator GlxA family with amidase domain
MLGALIAASCIGTFLVAETGLLDHREATTTWWLGPLFRQRYPNVLLDESRMLVPSDAGVTAGAAMGQQLAGRPTPLRRRRSP